MTTKTVKTILFASLIAAMILPFNGGMNSAVAQSADYKADDVANAFEDLEPYVKVNDKKIAKLDVANAKKNGISQESIKIVKEYLRIQNKMIQDIHDNPSQKMKISDEDKNKFKKFHDKVRNEGLKDKTVKTNYLDFLLPLANAAGCNYNGPHSQPGTWYSGSYTTVQDAIDDLPSGFEEVEGYAAAFTHDYHDWIVAYGCADGVFRHQSSIVDYQNDGDYDHRNNHIPGEPNPEVLHYGWPVWWWGNYVYNWHN